MCHWSSIVYNQLNIHIKQTSSILASLTSYLQNTSKSVLNIVYNKASMVSLETPLSPQEMIGQRDFELMNLIFVVCYLCISKTTVNTVEIFQWS